jgi:tetratricopeptide (TPR) repeat protein
VFDRILRTVLGVALAAALAVPWATGQQKTAKDQAESDLYTSISNEKDQAKKLGLLDQWTEKYPDTAFKEERNLFYVQAYSALAGGGMQAGATPDQLAAAEKADHTLIDKADTFFAPDVKMASVKAEDWAKAKTDVMTMAHKSLANIGMQRKDYAAAQAEYRGMLEANPNDAGTAYLLGTAIASEHKIARTPEALYQFARAALITGPGALTPAGQKETDAYLKKTYVGYHGDDKGLDDLKAMAAKSPFPPEGFSIKSVTQLSEEDIAKDEEFNKTHPEIVSWRNVKATLTAPSGDTYFGTQMKGAQFPKTTAKVISQTSAREITVSVDNATPETAAKAEATLKFTDGALKGTVAPGTEITFTGVPVAFNKDPYMVTFNVEKENFTGAELGPAAPTKAKAKAKTPVRKK